MAEHSPLIKKKKDKLTGEKIAKGEPKSTVNYTEHALGGPKRTRLSSLDSSLGIHSRRVSDRVRLESWEFPGWGSHFMMAMPPNVLKEIEEIREGEKKNKLSEWAATAICGNDILSSILYVSGLVSASAGWLSPVCLLIVAGILYLYRFIYGEAITALPLNGGSYNVLINTTSKAIASFAACLAIISYIATGVVSSASAIAYLSNIFPQVENQIGTVVLLFAFACLTGYGITESSSVALVIFCLHVFTLVLLVIFSSIYACIETDTLKSNLSTPLPDVLIGQDVMPGTFITALLLGVSSAMLGVSGFESSSQFIEEQGEGVFIKTLRNMWLGVIIFNPTISFLSLSVLSLDEIIIDSRSMLAMMAKKVGTWMSFKTGFLNSGSVDLGIIFQTWISIDAFIVLSGAVLTAYVGITGLIRRMAKDRCLPQFLLNTNKWRGTNHFIIFGFFLLAVSQVFILSGNIELLSGVYTFAFLGVMSIFSLGCALLKFKRSKLPREVTVSYTTIFLGLSCVLTALIGNMLGKPGTMAYFSVYFIAVGFVVFCVFQRIRILKMSIYFMEKLCGSNQVNYLKEQISDLRNQPYLFFCKNDDLYTINKAILYVRDNEQTDRLIVVHVSEDPESSLIKSLSHHLVMLDTMYPRIKTSLLTITGTFSPALIEWLSKELKIPKNMMFITCPDAHFKHKINQMGGIRVITH